MPGMDIDKIIQDLGRRFAAPLPEFYDRRIIFWYDEDNEFGDKLDDISIPDVKVYALTGSNLFDAKRQITRVDKNSNYLVHCPVSYDKLEDDWILDMELYSEEFRADLISIWMDELNVPASATMRKQMKAYRKFFNAKDRRAKFAKFKAPTTPAQLHLIVMAVLTGAKDAAADDIIRTVLQGAPDLKKNEAYQKLVDFGADQAFWGMVAQGTGYSEDEPDLGRLMSHLLLSATSRTMPDDYLGGLGSFISGSHQAWCYDFIYEWLHDDADGSLRRRARRVEAELKLPGRFAKVPLEILADTECFPCINEVLLSRIMADIGNDIIDPDQIRKIADKRRTSAWFDNFENFFNGIVQVANMHTFYKTHASSFHTVEAKKIWKEYTDEYYLMDTYYRRFHLSFQKSLMTSNLLLDDLFKGVVTKVEGLYSNWFLGRLCQNWTNMCADDLEKNGTIAGIPQQESFYRDKVKPCDSRIFVIISDAMRYEVAVELSQQLQTEMQSKVKLSSMQGIFPTITKFGMAALLPHDKLTVEGKGDHVNVLADGMSTDMGNRDAVLKAANPKSVALKYSDLITMKRPERNAAMKGMEVVYIYHDTIDEASHTSDTEVFTACEKAIAEIKNLIRIIIGDYGNGNFYITSDHGFLYTASPLKEVDKVGTGFSDRVIEYGRRFALSQKGFDSDYLMKVSMVRETSQYEGYAPRENVRIKMSGAGMQFVHGGTSLQEMVVPLIEYHHLRSDYAEYQHNRGKYDTKPVTVALLSASRKISNMIFSLNFYQEEAVGANREAATYDLYFVDKNGQKISDVQKIIADKTNENRQERTFRCSFSLKSQQYKNTENYYLVIADESGLQMPEKIEFTIDIAFATDDFNFFS